MATKHNGLSPWSQRFILSENRGQGNQRFFSLSSPLRGSFSLSRRKTLRITSGTRVRAYWRRNIMTFDFSRLAPVPWTDTIWNLAYANMMLWNGRKFSFPQTHFFTKRPRFNAREFSFPQVGQRVVIYEGGVQITKSCFSQWLFPSFHQNYFHEYFMGKSTKLM